MKLENLARCDIKLLVALQVLLEEESVSRAAERLHVTQSAMSKMLTRLSDLFGEELFFRGTQGIRATERALELQTPLSELLEQLGRLVSPPEFVVSDCDRTFRISLLDNVAARLCPPLLARLADEAPKVNIEMKPWGKTSFDDMANGQLDLALNVVEIDKANFYQQVLKEIDLCVLMNVRHPLANKKRLSLDEYVSYPYIKIIVPEFNENHVKDAPILFKHGLSRRVAFETSNMHTAMSCLTNTDYLMLGGSAMSAQALAEQGLTSALLPEEIEFPPFNYKMIWHQRQNKPAEHQWFRSLVLRELMALAQK
ncbi:hypothetical protein A3762_01865 [Oleiphilus sp. HI0125]|uniref:LysR family transcriptional regulator n=1 Tax=Oleiphilus sp. HI0125 TaxID=1822266 RepID=UPI0007C30248|nr:LysR family transcriptional regulator [Oleiphilus sp. HI0125]KZZ62849.1 hypothetical protein A3762_01865 [Oleiphilus sp. HI0125]